MVGRKEKKRKRGREQEELNGGGVSLVNASSSPAVKRGRRPVSSVCPRSVQHPRTQSHLDLASFFCQFENPFNSV